MRILNDLKKINRKKWVVWTLFALIYMFVNFHRLSTAAVKVELQRDFNIGETAFATIGSMYFWAYFLMQIPSGILADRIGPKKTTVIFSLVAAFGSILFGLSTNIIVAYASRFLVGLGVSVVFVCLVKVQTNWFDERHFAFMLGLSGLAGNVGALLAQTPLVIASHVFTWRKTFIALGIITLILTLLIKLFAYDKPIIKRDDFKNNTQDIPTALALRSVTRNVKTWTVTICYIGLYTGYILFLGTYGITLLSNNYSIDKFKSANYMIIAVLGAAVSGLIIGYLSDKIKRRKILLEICSVSTLICWISVVYFPVPIKILPIFLFLFGFVMSAFTLVWTIGNEVNNKWFSGMATGVINCFGFLGAALIPVLMGKVLDMYKGDIVLGYKIAFSIYILILVTSVVFSFLVTETYGENIYKK